MKNLQLAGNSKDLITPNTINKFQAVDNPKVYDTLPIGKILSIIKHGDNNLPIIQKAREYGKGSEEYDRIKAHYLPSFRFNFLFDGKANNATVIASTGLIYIDVDNIDNISDSEYIYAKWKSLSGLGYGILVRVEGLTLDNYKDTYDELASIIRIDADAGGRKATQQTVLSYDPNLYHNENSKVYICKEVSYDNKIKERKGLGAYDTVFENDNIRLNNIDEYFDDDTPYKVFNPKVSICQPYIPRVIPEGKRNIVMYYLLSQYALLNPNKKWKFLSWKATQINKKMNPPLNRGELNTLISNVLSQRERGELEIHYNQERKVLFNPKCSFTHKQKMEVVNSVLGKEKIQKSREMIYQVLEDWNFDVEGRITQPKVVNKTGLGIATVKRHWKEFKDYLEYLEK